MDASAEHTLPTISVDLRSASFGDKRLNRRLSMIADAIAETPRASLPSIFPREKDLEGTYRFLRNPRVTLERVLSPHLEATCERAQSEGEILVLHDTTEFTFEGEIGRQGLGPVQSGQGFFAHVALAVTADARRRPLGVLGVLPVIRKPTPKTKKRAAKSTPKVAKKVSSRELYDRPDKESLRWPELALQVEAQVGGRAAIVHVMDREADDYALLCALSSPRRFVVRRKHNRLISSDEPGVRGRKVQDALEEAAYRVERTVNLSARNNDGKAPKVRRLHPTRAARVATLLVRATQVTLVRPQGVPATFPAKLTLNVVHVQEVGAPEGEKPVDWVLFTNEAVGTKQEIERVVDIYRARWVIEDYFMALKTGCAFEQRQLESKTTLLNFLGILAPIAWRLLLLRNLARDEPDAPGSNVLPPSQLKVLTAVSPRKLPANPTALDVFLAVASLGGHIKNNGAPGWRVLARGYERLLTLEQGWLIARASSPASTSVNPRSAKR